MRFGLVLLCVVLLNLPAPLRAQSNAVVLELFTSQGCSSCPPADALLSELASRPGVVALALHVDYWDYLGWKDSFGHAAFTARQRAYAKWDDRRSVYTPQMVVQGQQMFIGHDAAGIERSIDAFGKLPPVVDLTIERRGDLLAIGLTPREPLRRAVDIHVVRFIPTHDVSIEAGENAGRNITYSSIVTDWETVARWDGASPVEVLYDDGGSDKPLAVIVQRAGIGPVLTAAKLP